MERLESIYWTDIDDLKTSYERLNDNFPPFPLRRFWDMKCLKISFGQM